MKRYYSPPVQSQKQIYTQFSLIKMGKNTKAIESAICPFCGENNIGIHEDSIKMGYITPDITCKHFNSFVAGDKMQITILFYGSSADLKE